MKITYFVEDIYVNKKMLQAILYCDPFINFNNLFINQFNITITKNNIQFDIIQNSEIIKTFNINMYFYINIKINESILKDRFKYFFIKNIHCKYDEYFTQKLILEFLNDIYIIIYELFKWNKSIKSYVLTNNDMFLRIDVKHEKNDIDDFFVQFPTEYQFNNIIYNYGLLNILHTEGCYYLIFKLQYLDNNQDKKIININEIPINDIESLIALDINSNQTDEAHFVIITPVYDLMKLIFEDKDIYLYLTKAFKQNFYNEELMNYFSNVNNFIYNIKTVNRFIKDHLGLIYNTVFIYFACLISKEWFNRDNLQVTKENKYEEEEYL